jgi:hypothetical protein
MTFFVFIGELFFRAVTVQDGFNMLGRIFGKFSTKAFGNGELLKLGMDGYDYIVVFIAIIVVFIVGLLKENNVNIRENISKKHITLRWLIYYLLILSIIVFGAYGPGYLPVDPIYADF